MNAAEIALWSHTWQCQNYNLTPHTCGRGLHLGAPPAKNLGKAMLGCVPRHEGLASDTFKMENELSDIRLELLKLWHVLCSSVVHFFKQTTPGNTFYT